MNNRCMCCEEIIKEVAPEKELCMECYEEFAEMDAEIEAIELARMYEPESGVCGCGNFIEEAEEYCPRCAEEQANFVPDPFIGY